MSGWPTVFRRRSDVALADVCVLRCEAQKPSMLLRNPASQPKQRTGNSISERWLGIAAGFRAVIAPEWGAQLAAILKIIGPIATEVRLKHAGEVARDATVEHRACWPGAESRRHSNLVRLAFSTV